MQPNMAIAINKNSFPKLMYTIEIAASAISTIVNINTGIINSKTKNLIIYRISFPRMLKKWKVECLGSLITIFSFYCSTTDFLWLIIFSSILY